MWQPRHGEEKRSRRRAPIACFSGMWQRRHGEEKMVVWQGGGMGSRNPTLALAAPSPAPPPARASASAGPARSRTPPSSPWRRRPPPPSPPVAESTAPSRSSGATLTRLPSSPAPPPSARAPAMSRASRTWARSSTPSGAPSPPHLDQAKVYYKLKRLKSKFLHAAPAAAAGPHDRRVRDLCNNVWGAHLVPPAEDDAEADEGGANERRTVPDAAAMLPVVTEVLDGYWKTNGRALSGVSLEKGLSLLATEDGRSVEAKWRRQLDAEVRTQMRRHDLAKEVYGLLIDAIKGLGP